MLITKVRLNIIYLFWPRPNGAPRAKPVVACLTPMWGDIPVIRLHIPPRPEAVVSYGRDGAIFDEEYRSSIRLLQVFEVPVQD
jgi:hypothetical protein